jgi:6-pyruvoyl-tetrahydropterin synthase
MGNRTCGLFMENMANVDCAVFDPTFGVTGQTWLVDVSLSGELDDNGFVQDFGALKHMVRQTLRSTLDHTLLLPVGSKNVRFIENGAGESWMLKSRNSDTGEEFEWEYQCPKGSVYPLRTLGISRDIVQQEFERVIRHRLPETVEQISVRFRDHSSVASRSCYRYTHGIQGHLGLCQRLFHGHRGRVEVYTHNQRRPDLEEYLTNRILANDVHIASPNQVMDGTPSVGSRGKTSKPVTLAYAGRDGSFLARIPENRVYFVEDSTSVECLTRQLAWAIKEKEKQISRLRVICYEGDRKGAVFEAN